MVRSAIKGYNLFGNAASGAVYSQAAHYLQHAKSLGVSAA